MRTRFASMPMAFMPLILLCLFIGGAQAATYVVNNTGDAADNNLPDGVCDSDVVAGKQCTLRAAIQNANTSAAADTINFNIPGPAPAGGAFIISPATGLSAIASGNGNGTFINGPSQTTFTGNTNPSGPEIVIDGGATSNGINGLNIFASNCTVRGLVINNFSGDGIRLLGASADLNRIEGCYIGTNAAGTVAGPGNAGDGVDLQDAGGTPETANTIGSTNMTLRNVISGNGQNGVRITRSGASANIVLGNRIGTNAAGTAAVPNAVGVVIMVAAKNNVIGGTLPGSRNLISGNTEAGVVIYTSGTDGNKVQGNTIGLNAAGTDDLANLGEGVLIRLSAKNNVIGGSTAGARNVISGNQVSSVTISGSGTTGNRVQGNYIGTSPTGGFLSGGFSPGVFIEAAAQNNTIGGSVAGARNVIGGFSVGVIISGSGTDGNLVQGNYIGVNATGTGGLGNTGGVSIGSGAKNNTIGGLVPGARNVIGATSIDGNLKISGIGTDGNVVQGNYLGLNQAGTAAMGSIFGLTIANGPKNNVIGGTVAGARNVISGFSDSGVRISGVGTEGNLVQGNYIGTNAAGTAKIPNLDSGVTLSSGCKNNVIGGTVAGAGNLISGNAEGIIINGSGTDGNKVQGNFIGTNAAGTARLPNGRFGVLIQNQARSNTIGGTVAGARNLISGHPFAGVRLTGSGTGANLVQGNFIGTDAAGTAALPNGMGVVIGEGASGNTVGGTTVSAGNRIAFNSQEGVLVKGMTSVGNRIRFNSIYLNGSLGINLQPDGEIEGEPTDNDLSGGNDTDSGPNNLQNYPDIQRVTVDSGFTTITGSVDNLANTAFILDFYRNSTTVGPDPSQFGEGEFYVTGTTVTTNEFGEADFTITVPGDFTGQDFTATATNNATGDTSEFSPFARARPGTSSIRDMPSQAMPPSTVALLTSEANASDGTVQLTFSGALDAAAAGDAARYSVSVNGFVVASSDASYEAQTFTVTLLLPDGSLKDGDAVSVAWRDLPASGSVTITAR